MKVNENNLFCYPKTNLNLEVKLVNSISSSSI